MNFKVIFDEASKHFKKTFRENCLYLDHAEFYFNRLLTDKRYVFLRDILEFLDIPVTKSSIKAGWLLEFEGLYPFEINILKIESNKMLLEFVCIDDISNCDVFQNDFPEDEDFDVD